MDKNQLIKLRKNLKSKDRKELASLFSCSLGHINHILMGNRINQEIINAAIDMALHNIKTEEEVNEKLSKL